MAEVRTGSAREAMLQRIRGIVGEAPPAAVVEREWAGLPRAYRAGSEADEVAKLELLVDRLHDYDAQVYRVSESDIARTVFDVVQNLAVDAVLVPSGLEISWLREGMVATPDLAHEFIADTPTLTAESAVKVGHRSERKDGSESNGLVFVEDWGFAPHELDRFTAVLTASTLAIAETGTIVLQNLPGQGRRAATLVPDVHLCVVREADVVATVPEAMRQLQATAALPTTFISGPSATADIEMTRIKGVHGPRFLHVLLVKEA